MMNVDEFAADWQPLEMMLRQDFLKSVVILDQLRQSSLSNTYVHFIEHITNSGFSVIN